jgi:CheY-like chemotaxis protein
VGIKILLADDSVTAQNMGKKILSEAGYEVVTVSNGAAAAKKIAELKPELVLLDVFMPGYGGLELCEKIRNTAETSKLPVLLTVGKMEPYSPQEGARVKADGVIIKPFEASDLTAAVERLAQKMKPAAKALQSETAKKASSSAEFSDESYLAPKKETASQPEDLASALSGSKKAPEPGYQPTMRLDAAEIAAMLKQPPAPAHSMEEFSVTPPTPIATSEPSPNADVPAFGIGIDQTSEIPSYMSQYLHETPTEAAVAAVSTTQETKASATPSFDPPPPSAPASAEDLDAMVALPKHSLLDHLEPATADANVVAPEGLEYTAAPPVPDVPVAKEVGFEPTIQTVDTPTMALKDPALVTDPHSATMDFVTQFGTPEPGLGDDPIQAIISSGGEQTSVDDFEARLNAAMNAFGERSTDLPQAELPGFPSPEIQVEAATGEFDLPRLESPTELDPFVLPSSANSELEVVAAEGPAEISPSFGETHTEFASSVSMSAQTSAAESTASQAQFTPFSLDTVAEAAMHARPALVEAVSNTVVPDAEPEIAAVSMEAISAPETDEAVIQQVREAFSSLPIDHSHVAEEAEAEPAPIAMAAAASATAAAAAPTLQIGREAELEIGRALSAAVAAETSTQVASADAHIGELSRSKDANNMAEAVENVMRRELPNLIWKIMAELDLRKRS